MSIAYPHLVSRDTNSTNGTQAYSVQPSQVWDGNDGAWSTFVIGVGSPAQYFRILPSTNNQETWIPVANNCTGGISLCGNARGVEPYNSGTSGPSSGTPAGVTLGMLDVGLTCTANKSPMCVNCISVNGKCTNGPCAGRQCCGDPPGECSSGGCNGVSGICTGGYIGCPCPGPDFNAAMSSSGALGASNPAAALGFLSNQSSTWSNAGNSTLAAESYLGISSQGQHGSDTLQIGADSGGLISSNNTVAGLDAQPFYLGSIGLKYYTQSPSLLGNLKTQKLIPSLSYGYTAGALYRAQSILGSLTLGGYDSSRVVIHNSTFPIDSSNEGSLVVPIQSIGAIHTLVNDSSLLPYSVEAIHATIDTTLPHMYLPASACKQFEKAFGLTWDSNRQYYLVNDSVHQQLQNLNPSVTFSLGSKATGSQTVNITLPYGAFDLQASNPIYPNGTNYFPLRQSANESTYTLGRAFFQEAYLLVDYEQKTFSVSQATYPVISKSNILTIDHSSHNNSTSLASSTNSSRLGTGTIAGVAVGFSVLVILLCTAAFFLIRRRRHDNVKEITWPSQPPPYTGTNLSPSSSMNKSHMTDLGYSPPVSSRKDPDMARELEDPASPVEEQMPMSELEHMPSILSLSKPLPRTPKRQELAGSEAANEMGQHFVGESPSPKVKHIYELASPVYDGKRFF